MPQCPRTCRKWENNIYILEYIHKLKYWLNASWLAERQREAGQNGYKISDQWSETFNTLKKTDRQENSRLMRMIKKVSSKRARSVAVMRAEATFVH